MINLSPGTQELKTTYLQLVWKSAERPVLAFAALACAVVAEMVCRPVRTIKHFRQWKHCWNAFWIGRRLMKLYGGDISRIRRDTISAAQRALQDLAEEGRDR